MDAQYSYVDTTVQNTSNTQQGVFVKENSLRNNSSDRELEENNEEPMSIDTITIKNEPQENVDEHTFYENLTKKDNNINISKDRQITQYECPICHEFFVESANLITHMKKSHTRYLSNRLRAQCPICNKILRLCNLTRHLKYHVGIKDFQCSICNKSFTDKCNLIYHMGIHTGRKKDFCCPICDKRFVKDKFLTKHMKVHSKKKKVKNVKKEKKEVSVINNCPLCHQVFVESKNLIKHIESHTRIKTDKRSQCAICSKSVRHCNLKRHLKLHVGIKDFRCTVCNKAFTQNESLKYHMSVHTGVKIKKFQCDLCRKKFLRICLLKAHMLTHSDPSAQNIDGSTAQGRKEQNNEQICIKDKQMEEYSTVSTGNHKNEEKNSVQEKFVEEKLNEEQPMKQNPADSKYCNENIEDSSQGLAKDNINTCEDNQISTDNKCLICHKLIFDSEKLIKHMKNHFEIYSDKKAQCPICSKFVYLCNIKRHLKSHVGIKDFHCPLCNKFFTQKESLKYHFTIHTGVKIKKFECDICHKKFGKKYLWTKHITTHTVIKQPHCTVCKGTCTETSSGDANIECAAPTENKNKKNISINKKTPKKKTNESNNADVITLQEKNDQKFEEIFIKEEPVEDDDYLNKNDKILEQNSNISKHDKSADIDKSGHKLRQNNEKFVEECSTQSECYKVRNVENILVKEESREGSSNDHEFYDDFVQVIVKNEI